MARQKLDAETIDRTVRLPAGLDGQITVLMEETGVTRSEVIRELIGAGITVWPNMPERRPARQRAPKVEAGPNPAGVTRVKDRKPVSSSPASSHDVTPIPKASWR